jgi:uncharacterized phiE125 gp8 family phage protein
MLFTLTPIDVAEGYGEGILPLADAKAHLRILHDDEDHKIAFCRDAAVQAVERYTNVQLGRTSGIVAKFEGFGPGMRMGIGPAATVEVTGISYVGSDGAPVAMDAGSWRLDVLGGLLPALNTAWPTTYGPVTVTCTAGYTDQNRPPVLVMAARMMLVMMFENWEAMLAGEVSIEAPKGFRFLCDQVRMPVI